MKEPSVSAFASPDARLRRRIRQRKQPVQARAQATTEALLDATLQVLIRDGYARLTTTRVAERAGVSVGTLYQYYPDKRSLVTALKVRYFGLMVGAMRTALDAEHGSVEALMRAAIAALLTVKRENFALTKALRAPMAELAGQGFMRETQTQFAAVLVPHVRRVLPDATEVERRVVVLVAAVEGAVSQAVFETPEWLREDWFLDELVALGAGYLGASRARNA